MDVIQTTVNSFMRQVKSRPRKKNWLNVNIWSLMKQRGNALKQFLKSKMECEK